MPRRGENIYKRKDNRWEARIAIGYTAEGKKRYYSLYGDSYLKVKEKKKQYEENNVTLTNCTILRKDVLFQTVVEQWLEKNATKLKQTTYSTYLRILNSQVLPQLKNKSLKTINAEFLNTFLSEKLVNGKLLQEGGLADKTVRDLQILLNSIFTFAEEFYGYPNPCTKLKQIRFKCNRITTLNITEQNTLKQYIFDHFDEKNCGILMSLYMGIRLGEACALQWADIDFNHKVMHIRKTVSRVINPENKKPKTILVSGTPKTPASIREIPIPDFLLELLKQLNQKNPNPQAYILTGLPDKCMDPRTYQLYLKKILQETSLPCVNYHCLRHTFATTCISIGFDVKTLSEILGHSNVNITLNRYVHSTIEAKQRQMEMISSVF